MEDMVNMKLFNNIYKDKRVLVTGHTGFKGSWLSLWLKLLGAKVTGYALSAPTEPSHFELLGLDINHVEGDILDEDKLEAVFRKVKPEIVFHLAAQPLVRESYNNPVLTYKTNIIGTLNVFEACRKTPSVKAIINVTSDKCYSNKEIIWGYRETDEMGGYDPYSSSKGCAELLTSSYRNSFFNNKNGNTNVLLASARAGNVIGGGDWAKDRLIPDIMKAVSQNCVVQIRNPKATRPWQHVLEPLSGYLLLGAELYKNGDNKAEAWNFGPDYSDTITVEDLLVKTKNYWSDLQYTINRDENQPHEANSLFLDCSKAKTYLEWKPVWNCDQALKTTVEWYKNYYEEQKISSIDDIIKYVNTAINKGLSWTK
jgi:CDP-glucose 4,6-dehydratase